ncbi:MAG: Hsp20/alpha crystallin family protein [Burkholderiaceae bacterium]|nr:Hsp20/alpha crystallin family protein [Burkholderiaceae bacterium]
MATRTELDRWMWMQACELLGQAERLQRQFFRPGAADRAQPAWEPPIDVFDDERETLVVVAMPGVVAERVQVVLEDGALVVRGVRPLPAAGAQLRLRRLEIPHGAFERHIALAPGRYEMDPPELADGCLQLRLRRAAPEGR